MKRPSFCFATRPLPASDRSRGAHGAGSSISIERGRWRISASLLGIVSRRCKKLLDPIPPGEILREEFMRPMGISINALARDLDVPPNRISAIVGGKRSITADTALRLGKYFGVSPEIWLDLQSDFDLRKARRTTWKRIEARVRTRAA